VAGVLHLGNIDFALSSRDEAIVAGGSAAAALEAAARLLGVRCRCCWLLAGGWAAQGPNGALEQGERHAPGPAVVAGWAYRPA
jgi:hypothetical protein